MSTDRELLEYAARAYGLSKKFKYLNTWYYFGMVRKNWAGVIQEKWNPLTDDGDALRLAVKLSKGNPLRINGIELFTGHVVIHHDDRARGYRIIQDCGADTNAAVRRAIARAAAEIGKAME